MMCMPDFSEISFIIVASRPSSIGQGSTNERTPCSLRSCTRRRTASSMKAGRSNFAVGSNSAPGKAMNRCSCISVRPSRSTGIGPVTVCTIIVVSPTGRVLVDSL
jgi:hypothetical protein